MLQNTYGSHKSNVTIPKYHGYTFSLFTQYTTQVRHKVFKNTQQSSPKLYRGIRLGKNRLS